MPVRKSQEAVRIQAAKALAIEALGWLASDPDRIERFLALYGLGPANLRQAAATPGFFPAILDYLAGSENLLIAFAEHSGRRPEAIARASESLSPPPDADP